MTCLYIVGGDAIEALIIAARIEIERGRQLIDFFISRIFFNIRGVGASASFYAMAAGYVLSLVLWG